MKSKLLGVAGIIFAGGVMLGATSSAQAVLIDFEAASNGPLISEDGYDLSANSGVWGIYPIGDNGNVPESGSQSALLNGGTPASFTLTNSGGNNFDLMNFRVSEGRNINTNFFPFNGSTGITVQGFFSGGGSITTNFNMDVMASDNGATDFQLVNLAGFSGLSSADFTAFGGTSGYSFGIDDINVDITVAVPEPGTLTLFGLGLAGLGLARRRKVA